MMRNTLLTLLAGGFLLAGAALLILRWTSHDAPAEFAQNNHAGKAGNDPRAAYNPRDPVPSRKRMDRSRQPFFKSDPTTQKALDDLSNATEDEQSDKLNKISAAWPKDHLASSVANLFSKDAADSADAVTRMLRISLLRRWVSHDPTAAAAWAGTLPEGDFRAEVLQQVSLIWETTDPAAAWDWLNNQPKDNARDSAMLSLLYEISNEQPELAISRADALSAGPERSQLIEHAIGNWAVTDPRAALAIVREISDPDLRNDSMARLTTSWAEADPHAAATLAADAMDSGPAQNRAVASIVQRWAQQDPAAAREWVDSFRDGPLKENALEHIFIQSAPKITTEEETAD